jgi:hypothetical protein
MIRIPFEPSEDSKPSPLWTGPRCTCTPAGATITIEGEKYLALSRIMDTGCPEHGAFCDHVPSPHEGASRKGGPKL